MNKFADWVKNNHKKKCGIAKYLKISESALQSILNKNQVPKIKVAYEIEKYTHGAITLYDWVDQGKEEKF